MPELAPLGGELVGLGVPGPLEPLVGPGEDEPAGHPLLPHDPEQRGVGGHRLGLAVAALVAAVGAGVRRPERGRHPELGDHHRHPGEVLVERGQVAGVRVGLAVDAGGAQPLLVAQEVREVRVGVEVGEGAAGPGPGGQHVVGVDPDAVLLRLGSSGWVSGSAVGQLAKASGTETPRALGRRQRVEVAGEPALGGGGGRGGGEVAAGRVGRVREPGVGTADAGRVPLHADHPGRQPRRDVGAPGAARVAGAGSRSRSPCTAAEASRSSCANAPSTAASYSVPPGSTYDSSGR